MSDSAKQATAQLVVVVFLATTFVLHIVHRTLSWRSILFTVVGMFVVSLTLGVLFYLLDLGIGLVLARLATPGPKTDAIVRSIGCLKTIPEIAVTIAVTVYAFRSLAL